MTLRQILAITLLTCAALVSGTAAWGQATTSLRGTVTDKSGAIVSDAAVTLTNLDTNQTRATRSTAGGVYELVSILPGRYKLTVAAKGFRTYVEPAVILQVSLPATANVQLEVGAAAETVEVTGEAPLLNTTDASLGHTMGDQAIEQLPLRAEQMPLLLSFQPGVVYTGDQDAQLASNTDTRGGAVNGERSDQNNITLDGVSVNDEFNGYAFTGVLPSTQFSVQEFRVTTSNYGASEGRSAGAQIEMVTKGGTNKFHGNLYEFNRNTVGEANDFFLKNAELANDQPNVPQKLIRNDFGGSIGGPLIKNRLFFFFNYEGHRQSFAQSIQRTIPSDTLRDGIIQYLCDEGGSGQLNTGSCPGGSVTGISGKSYQVAPGYYALGPSQLAGMDPLHIGPSTVATQYFNTYATPNVVGQTDYPNYAGYRFAAPTTLSENWYIARIDYNLTANGNHTLFLRGAARDDHNNSAPFLPGDAPESSNVDLSKGIVVGYTATLSPRLVNNFRYGLTHQSIGSLGNTDQPWVQMRDLDQGIVYSGEFTAPVHNLADTLSWQKGAHNLQFGGNLLFIRRGSDSYGNSFSDALTNSDWLSSNGFAGKNSPLNPTAGGFPAVDSSFTNSYDFPLAAMMGIASELDARYNYKVVSTTSASPLAQGAPVARNWATDTYNLFVQDTWQARHNLTFSYGLNYQLMTPITENNGQEVAPNVNMGTWFAQRANNGLNGIPDNTIPPISFQPAGSYYGRSGLYSAQTKNFAPRIGIAWSPDPKWGWLKRLTGDNATVVRAGFGMYYDNFGPALALNYDATGTFGLSSYLQNPAAVLTLNNAPRISGMNVIPTMTSGSNPQNIFPPAPSSTFPVQYPLGSEAIADGIDQSLKTPYSYAVNLTIERQLPGKMVMDVGYVGHFGHRLLALDDVATPLDLVDPKTHIDYFTAATRLSQLARSGTPTAAITPQLIGPTSQYWLDMFQGASSYPLCSTGGTTTNMLAAIYDQFGPGCNLYNETSALYNMDLFGNPVAPVGGANSYYNSQYSSLWDWRSMANSSYNALQAGLHKDMSNGILFGFNYTYSKCLDIESMAERGVHYLTDSIINAWDPSQMHAPCDFDLRHQINGYWVAELPIGRGKAFGNNMNHWADAVIGGWQLGGTVRWTSGYPFSVYQGYVWPTNWDEMGWSIPTSQPIQTGTSVINGIPNAFSDPSTAGNSFDYAYPGQSGVRNNVRGNGYFTLDANLSKNWKIPKHESQSFQLRWSVFNVTNSVRFDIFTMQDNVSAGGLGDYTSTLTQPRIMEFSGIYTF